MTTSKSDAIDVKVLEKKFGDFFFSKKGRDIWVPGIKRFREIDDDPHALRDPDTDIRSWRGGRI
jgi:hypothetical protein